MNKIKCREVLLNAERRGTLSFAINHESLNTDLRYIQELLAPLDSEHLMGLGHKRSKTPIQSWSIYGAGN